MSSSQPMPVQQTPSKVNLGTVLGLKQAPKTPPSGRSSRKTTADSSKPLTRSASATRNSPRRLYTSRRRDRAGRSSVAETNFFEQDLEIIPRPSSNSSLQGIEDPATDLTNHIMDNGRQRSTMRRPIRIDQDGPWSISVAESPDDPHAYCLYIKTPTHNLTLTRNAMEMIELDYKLRESNPGLKLPQVPVDTSLLPNPPKRKSTFLNTLSRLASPTSNKTGRRSNAPTRQHSPESSPGNDGNETDDPFTVSMVSRTEDEDTSSLLASPNAATTGIASYLTNLSNNPQVRQARPWKRFVRVRTDDLESVRVERAIKRVRSDLAAHLGGSRNKENKAVPPVPPMPMTVEKPLPEAITEKHINGISKPPEKKPEAAVAESVEQEKQMEQSIPESEVEKKEADTESIATAEATAVKPSPSTNGAVVEESKQAVAEEEPPETPTTKRLHRSKSAEPDKSSRMTESFTSSSSNLDGADGGTSSAASATGDDDSSVDGSKPRKMRKKRVKTNDPTKLVTQKSSRKVVIDDFEMMRVLGKGCAGKVLLVKHKSSTDLYALKAITKRHVLAHQELQHTLTEQAVLKRMAAANKDPFVVKLWWSFHDKENLFLVMDFHPGGDLATQLARWGRLGRDRARFYAAEIVEGVEGLHYAGVIYRDLKPENILIGGDGHIVLTDFGLSKEFAQRSAATLSRSGSEFFSSAASPPDSSVLPTTPPWMKLDEKGEMAHGWPAVDSKDVTSTFCGTAEYLAPEVIQGQPYSYEVDWWSFGTMLFEMLTGITPFWANNHSDMYVRVLQDELQFPDDRAIDQDTKSLIRGLLQRNPSLRMCEPRIKRHPYFSMIDWSHVYYKRYIPPYIPPIDPSNASDTQNFDDTFLDMEPVINDDDENEETTDNDRTDGEESNTTPSQSRSSSIHPPPIGEEDESVDVFDGYSFKGRHSVLIDDEDADEEGSSEEEDEEDVGKNDALRGVLEANRRLSAALDDEDGAEPKTPEARPISLPDEDGVRKSPTTAKPPSVPVSAADDPKARRSKDLPRPAPGDQVIPPSVPAKDAKAKNRMSRPPRREKSGIPALDRDLSDTADETGDTTERDEDEDDWDMIDGVDGEDKNGAKGTTLFARGVVDKYRLAVLGKGAAPSQAQRSTSGLSEASMNASPASSSQRRGKNQGFSFRKNTRQFLRPKSPPSSYTKKSMSQSGSLSSSKSLSKSNGTGTLAASSSTSGTLQDSPSLKSKQSFGAHSHRSDSSATADQSNSNSDANGSPESSKVVQGDDKKNKKLKKYKENAEKVFSIFSSPRPGA